LHITYYTLHINYQLDSRSLHREYDKMSLEHDFTFGYQAHMTELCVGRESEVQRLLEISHDWLTPAHLHTATLLVGPTGSGKSAVLAKVARSLQQQHDKLQQQQGVLQHKDHNTPPMGV
jgi:flagellar biosynthesis GTPase FlhF